MSAVTAPTSKMSNAEIANKSQNSLGPQKKSSKPSLDRKSCGTLPGKSKIPKQEKTLKDDMKDNESGSTGKPDDTKSFSSDKPLLPRSISSIKDRNTSKYSKTKLVSTASSVNQARILENKFNSKSNNYKSLKSQIEDKQKQSESAYEELLQLRNRIVDMNGKDPGKLEDLVPLPAWSAQIRQIVKLNRGDGILTLDHKDSKFVNHLENNLRCLVDSFANFCSETLEKQRGYLTDILEQLVAEDAPMHLRDQIEQYKDNLQSLQSKLEDTRQEQCRSVSEVVHRTSCLWHECEAYKAELEQTKSSAQIDSGTPNDELTKELRFEKERMLKARAKIRELENGLSSSESKLNQAQEQIKQLENQLKHKETTFEQRTKDISRSHKAHEAALNKLTKEKESIEANEKKLKEELATKENEFKKLISDLERDLEDERNARQEAELEFQEIKLTYEKLEEKCKQLLEMQEETKQLDTDNRQHSDYEIELFNDLKETKQKLVEKEELIKKLKIEREEILSVVNERADADDSNDSKEKLAAELVKRSNELEALTNQFNQLQKSYDKIQRKNQRMEQKLQLQAHIKEQAIADCGKGGARASYESQMMLMQQQLADLTGSLSESRSQNAELEKTCTQLQVKLEHCKRFLCRHDKGLRVRTELAQLLQHLEQSSVTGSEPLLDQQERNNYVSADSANASEDYRQLFTALEDKEMQLMKLEKVVKQMEKQDEYSQLQRTRLESRIAKLELALKEAQQAHRNRGFSFL